MFISDIKSVQNTAIDNFISRYVIEGIYHEE